MRTNFGDSDFCDKYRGTSGILGRLVLFIDRLWMRKVIGICSKEVDPYETRTARRKTYQIV